MRCRSFQPYRLCDQRFFIGTPLAGPVGWLRSKPSAVTFGDGLVNGRKHWYCYGLGVLGSQRVQYMLRLKYYAMAMERKAQDDICSPRDLAHP